MYRALAAVFSRARTVSLLLVLIVLAGGYSYVTVPKEATPEIETPYFVVTVTYPGISAEDSARLLVEPLERQLQSIAGLRRMDARAADGFATVTLEFDPGFDHQAALQSVRDETDNATPKLPAGADAPSVREIDLSLFPILTVALSGDVPERELIRVGRQLEERLESVSGVLEADISGAREDLMEVIIDPLALQSHGLSPREVSQAIRNNNQLVTAGAFDTGSGRIGVSIPGTIQSAADVLVMPVQVTDNAVVRVQDVAEVRQTFQDPVSFARIGGQPTIGLDISKTSGANIIDTVADVQAVVEEMRADWPESVQVDYLLNQAEDVADLLGDLENNVIAAVVLVMLTMILALGVRASLLVAIAIPSSFLAGILAINLIGFTLNIVVLFALILVIGMLVDGAIVVVELAERYREEGRSRQEAFLGAAQRMAWPLVASTATTLAVFIPLLFWPGVAGQFMRYLPATVIVTLTASLLMALVFVPVIGSLLPGGNSPAPAARTANGSGLYGRMLHYTVARPGFAVGLSLLVLLGSFALYGALGKGVNFFPAVEPERAQIQVRADGNLSVQEADRLVRLVEDRVMDKEGVDRVYARTIGSVEARLAANLAPDVIGTIQIDFDDWRHREPAAVILDRIREATESIPGLGIQIQEQESGPGDARPVQIELSAADRERLGPASRQLQELMAAQGTFVDIASDVPMPQPEIRLQVNREQAARYGVDIATLGDTVQLLTNGLLLGSYLPEFAPDEVDIRLRYPLEDRTFAQLAELRIATERGMMPITNFVELTASPAPSVINRVDGRNVQTVSADIVPGTTVTAELATLREAIAASGLDDEVDVGFAGEVEDQQEAMIFLVEAFVVAIFLMFLVLLTQLNSFFQSLLVLSAIVFSFAGVFLGLLVRQEPFSVVMSGIGIMALAGIVVNNNIVLIDAYNAHRGAGLGPTDAALRAGSERLRPVLLTAITTIVGLLPMVFGMTVDFFARDLFFGAPSGQFWVQLATAIVGGLAVATFITVLLTPALLAWDGKRRATRTAPSTPAAE
ncbi:efflux RND transporter permease subunit [Aquisalimonas lutea]|uniref:efflux RND transporter permease subunit n=1 Tax=Aquisalimonas lutea TaxID=1327750 RepID=UPI0025B319BC|nr:efflux RND transporter permease subunit [Aquisalimonas lutea]MDN3519126.1 efflux RND transporter permease subunit [Aquisalimonas lutea]